MPGEGEVLERRERVANGTPYLSETARSELTLPPRARSSSAACGIFALGRPKGLPLRVPNFFACSMPNVRRFSLLSISQEATTVRMIIIPAMNGEVVSKPSSVATIFTKYSAFWVLFQPF